MPMSHWFQNCQSQHCQRCLLSSSQPTEETNTHEQVCSAAACLQHWTRAITPRPLRCISRLRLHCTGASAPLWPLKSSLLQDCHLTSYLLSHLIPRLWNMYMLRAFRFLSFAQTPPPNPRCTLAATYWASPTGGPISFSNLNSSSPAIFPVLHGNSVPSCCSDTKPGNHSGLLLFLMSLIQGFINPVGSIFKIHPNSNH